MTSLNPKFLILISIILLLNFKDQQKSVLTNNASCPQDTTVLNPQYYLLQKAMWHYQEILAKGGWDSIPEDINLEKIGINAVSIPLKNRLGAEGYLLNKNTLTMGDLKESLKLFQANNGLAVTGNLDSFTINTLNISPQQRIDQLKINSERWMAEPCSMGKYYLFVNVADFSMKVVKNDTVRLQMKIIVGRPYRPTPVFHARLTHLIFNPTWNIPPTILKNDILPAVKKNRSYLRKKHIRVFRTVNGVRREVSINSINWKRISAENFPYELIEDPGPNNPLGVVKFMFPNSHNVYMHDTPTKELFKETELTFSSGCIRLSKALDLANYLLKNAKGWDEERIKKTVKKGKTIAVLMPEPIEVYIEYFTAWVNEHDILQFRKDIYNKDIAVE